MRTILFATALLALTACRDREQDARATGEQARAGVAAACASAKAVTDDPFEIATVHADCAERACAGACRSYEGARAIHAACIAACIASGDCATDADCNVGLRCVAIAPRVRRCGPAAPSPASSSP